MATTTNYSWTTPDDTALVKDGASAIRTLGSSIDTTTKNLNPSTTLGDIEYRSSTANTNTRLAIGTTGQVLTVSSGVPAWATPAGAKVLQVVSATKTDTFTSSTGNTFVDVTGLSVSITPSLATSKILVFAKIILGSNAANGYAFFKLVRNSTDIFVGDSSGSRVQASGGGTASTADIIFGDSAIHLDSPSTTSSTTYKIQIYAQAGTGTAYVNRSYADQNANSTARTASSITVMEIGA